MSEIRQTLDDIFHVACELEPQKRAEFLDTACAGNAPLRAEIEDLLKNYEDSDTFLEKPVLHDVAQRLAKEITSRRAPSDTLREGDWMIGRYRILGELGRGGMGVVYLAEDTQQNRQVAIKVMPEDFIFDEDRLARFNREARMLEELRHLKHPSIAEIYEQIEYEGKPCLVLEYVPGDTLDERLQKGAMPLADALQLGLQLAGALASAHQNRIVHRDLKPANIKITPDGNVKVLDFGLAKRFYPDNAQEAIDDFHTRSLSLTESGMLIGTPAYMSPEQWDGKEIDQRTDIWAFGCLFYEMLTGNNPFARKTRAETMKAAFEDSPDWSALPEGTPIVIQDLLRKCLQKDTNSRLGDAGEAERIIAETIKENKFAFLLLIKSWIWKIDRQTAITLAASALVLAFWGVWEYTPLPSKLFPSRIQITEKDDIMPIFSQRGIEKTELARAVLMPGKQSLQERESKEWRDLSENADNKARIEEIIRELNNTIAKDRQSAQLHAILAQAYLFKFYLAKNQDDKDEALKAVRKAQTLNAKAVEVLIAEGNVLLAIGKFSESIEIFEKANNDYPNEPDILLGLAMAHEFKSGEKTSAEDSLIEDFYKRAIEARKSKTGEYWGDYNELGWHYFGQGKDDLALQQWREVINLAPTNPTGYLNLGSAYYFLGCIQKAIDYYRSSITNAGNSVEAHVNLGAAYFYLGNYEDSIGHLSLVTQGEKAKEDVYLIDAWANLGDSYLHSDRRDEAKLAYDIALRLINKFLIQARNDNEKISLKAEIIAKLVSLGVGTGQDNPIALINPTLDPKFNCQVCIASAVTIYLLADKKDEALQMARRAVDEGYSPILLVNNPDLFALKDRTEFKRIQREAQEENKYCQQ